MVDEELKALFEGMRQENAAAHAETRRHAESLIAETRQDISDVAADLRGEIAETRQRIGAVAADLLGEIGETRQQIGAVAAELRGEIAETRGHLESAILDTRHQLEIRIEAARVETQLVGEGVLLVREELKRIAELLDEKIDHTAAETQSMIKFSHVELDRRITTLEDTGSRA